MAACPNCDRAMQEHRACVCGACYCGKPWCPGYTGHPDPVDEPAPGAAPAAKTPRDYQAGEIGPWTGEPEVMDPDADDCHNALGFCTTHHQPIVVCRRAPAAETPPPREPVWTTTACPHCGGEVDGIRVLEQGPHGLSDPAPPAETPPPVATLQEMGAAFAERLRQGGAAPETIAAYERAVETTIARYMGWPLPADPRDQTIRQMHEDSLTAVRETAKERDAARAALAATEKALDASQAKVECYRRTEDELRQIAVDAEAALAALRARVEALAAEWEREDGEPLTVEAKYQCARALRAALSGEGR